MTRPKTRWIVELEPGVWIAPWTGDPGRTTARAHAAGFVRPTAAQRALDLARDYRPFRNARIVPVTAEERYGLSHNTQQEEQADE